MKTRLIGYCLNCMVHYSSVKITSQLPSLRLKSPAIWVFVQPLVLRGVTSSFFRTAWLHTCLMEIFKNSKMFLAATKQLKEHFSPSVPPSASVCFCMSHLFHYVPLIVSSWNLQELLPLTKVYMQKVKVRGQMSKVKITEVKANFAQIWMFPDRISSFKFTDGYEMMHIAWNSKEEVPCCLSRSYVKFRGYTGQKIANFDTNRAFPECNSSLN